MTRPAIRIENLGKRYLVDHEARGSRGGYRTLRESLSDMVAAPFKKLRGERTSTREEFWALKDVSFEVQPGEVVGIIGRNGAGKSTLLKILSQITKPTKGRIELNGRVGSLLEVGTGFHPELTGRENIYLNGSILGMKKREINRKFDEIVDFAEIEQFLDTPVKRYSSGMYVRLAFAVAAHLEPEILIIDEVLSVGDQSFQRKCLQRMNSVASEGCTVLIVSHDLPLISCLSSRAACLAHGSLIMSGPTRQTVEEYLRLSNQSCDNTPYVDLTANRNPRILRSLQVKDGAGNPTLTVAAGSCIQFELCFDSKQSPRDLNVTIGIADPNGIPLSHISSHIQGSLSDAERCSGFLTCTIPSLPLLPGEYMISVRSGDTDDYIDVLEDVLRLKVIESDYFGTGKLPKSRFGCVLMDAQWAASPGIALSPAGSHT